MPPALRMWSKVTMADGKVLSKERHGAELQQACLCMQSMQSMQLCARCLVRRLLRAHRTRYAYFILCIHAADLP